jgi:hypothetical protein
MVHGENTAKMEFLTANAKIFATHKKLALSMSRPERLIQGRPNGENQTERVRAYLTDTRAFTG